MFRYAQHDRRHRYDRKLCSAGKRCFDRNLCSGALWLVVLLCLAPCTLLSQANPNFNVYLRLDAESAEQTIALFADQMVNTGDLAGLRGNIIAASTAGYISGRSSSTSLLRDYFDSLKYHQIIRDDMFHLEEGRANLAEVKELLKAMTTENFGTKVSATVEQIFPIDARVDVTIPVYVVAFGHENVDAFVRRIVWHRDVPEFVGESEGELTIVVNLSHAVHYGPNLQTRFVSLLGVVAHEVFHAAFGSYKERSPAWISFNKYRTSYFDNLIDISHNEGIAYYLSLEQQGHGRIPSDWSQHTAEAMRMFNSNSSELLARGVVSWRAAKILRNANLAGYWESYGAMTGMFIAREIDLVLGRAALIETIEKGPDDFFQKYIKVMNQDSNLPRLSLEVMAAVSGH